MTATQRTLLFQGDSITDAGRERSSPGFNEPAAMGRGYAFLVMCRLLAKHPGVGLQVHNRGISGDRVPDLRARWQQDTVALAPDVLSILIGVNDLWHQMDGRYAGSVADYERGLGELLGQTRRALPQTRLVLCEPFVLRCGAVTERWFPEFDERRAAAARVAADTGALFVPFQSSFDRALATGSGPEYWAADGVHPTPAGHQLMADTWVEATASALAATG